MFSDKHLLPTRRLLAAALSVAALGMVSPAWAHQSSDDDDASGDKKEIRVYRMGDDDTDQGKWTDRSDRDDRDEPGDRNDRGDRDDSNGFNYRYKVERADAKGGYLGVQVQDITRSLMRARDLPSDEGALVNRVEGDSPADEAGIERGDVIVEVDGQSIKDSQDLIGTMRDIKPGAKVDVTVLRDGARKSLRVEVGKRPHDTMVMGPGFRWRAGAGMDPEQMKEFRERVGKMKMDSDEIGNMRMMMQGPEFRQQLDELRKEVESLKEQIRDLKEELRNSRDGRSDR